MAAAAIQIQYSGLGLVRLREFTWLRLVLMGMVPQMFGSNTVFVLAIGGRCSPGELHRNHHQQEKSEPFAHEEHCSSFKFYMTFDTTARIVLMYCLDCGGRAKKQEPREGLRTLLPENRSQNYG